MENQFSSICEYIPESILLRFDAKFDTNNMKNKNGMYKPSHLFQGLSGRTSSGGTFLRLLLPDQKCTVTELRRSFQNLFRRGSSLLKYEFILWCLLYVQDAMTRFI